MFVLQISTKAQADLETIAQYTLDCYGPRQMDLYLQFFEKAFHKIVKAPKIGREYRNFTKNYRILAVQKHIVVYTIKQKAIFIVRILHGRMDIKQHLNL